MSLKIVFMGTPEFSVPVLEGLVAAGHEIVAVYTQPPRPAGRGLAETTSPVHRAAAAHGLPVMTPKSLKGAAEQEAFAALGADVAVVVAYGLLLPKAVLEAPRFGCLNLHASALPRWRGAAPIQRAIMAGDAETAVMVMQMEEGLDTGPVCLAHRVPISRSMTAGDLHDALARVGPPLMVEAMRLIEAGQLTAVPQSADGVTYAAKILKEEARIDFSKRASEVADHIHGLSPFPGAWFEVVTGSGASERLKVLRVCVVEGAAEPGTFVGDDLSIACGTGAIRILEAQRAGKKPMLAGDLLRGFAIAKGTRVKVST